MLGGQSTFSFANVDIPKAETPQLYNVSLTKVSHTEISIQYVRDPLIVWYTKVVLALFIYL